MALLRSRAPRQIARRKIDLLVYCSDDAVRVFTALNMGKEGGIFPRFETASSSMGSMFSRARIQLRTARL